MISLKKYINLPTIKENNIKYYKSKYIGDKDLILEEDYINSSFDRFIELNDINILDDELYKYYIEENFSENRKRYYGIYQKKIYESILNSYSASDLMEKIYKLSDNIEIFNIQYVNKNKITQFSFEVKYEDDLNNIFTNKVISLLHLYNYYLKTREIERDENNQTHYKITIEPYKPKDITNIIYNDLNGILYHITLKETYINKIKFKELLSKWKGLKNHKEYRDGRIFFIGNNDVNNVKHQLRSILNTNEVMTKDNVVVLKIDLNKYKHKLRFRIDSSASGYNAYFTEEPIPDFCITCLDFNTFKETNL